MNLTRTALPAIALAAALAGFSQNTFAQHYPAGAEGLKGATLPPEGIYLRDYNFFYFAPEPGLPGLEDVFAYVNAPRVIWMTPWKILGADYGMDLIVPFGYTRISAQAGEGGRISESEFGLGDIQFEPLLLSWHEEKMDIAAGYAIWAPTGDFDSDEMVNIGSGFWTHMFTAGATAYLDEQKTWAISLLNRYEISQEQDETDVTPGHVFTAEFGISKTVAKSIDLGAVGYWQQQVTKSEQHGHKSATRPGVLAMGPEISGVIPQIGVIASVRYLREFSANSRPEGNLVSLTLTKRF